MDVKRFNEAAIFASLIVQPMDDGLLFDELVQVGAALGMKRGQIEDTLKAHSELQSAYYEDDKIRVTGIMCTLALNTGLGMTGLPSGKCVDCVLAIFKERADDIGAQATVLQLSEVRRKAEDNGHDPRHATIAVALLLGVGTLVRKGEGLGIRMLSALTQTYTLRKGEPSTHGFVIRIPSVLPTVKDVMSRRDSGVPSHPEPLHAFHDALDQFGHKPLQRWWAQMTGELSRASEQLTPVTCILLSAALGEAALTAIGTRAQVTQLTMKDLPPVTEPKQWRFDTLIRLAKSGQRPILDGSLGGRCADLNEKRQRIHAARFINATLAQVDYRPEEARDAKSTLDQLVRAVLDWMDKNLPSPRDPAS